MDKLFDSSWALRITALVLAVVLFFYVQSLRTDGKEPDNSIETDILLDVPLEVFYDEDNLIVTGLPATVDVKITIVLITHEMEVINSICDEVAVMENGKLVEHGSVEAIFTNPKEAITNEFIKKSLDISLPSYYQEQILKEEAEAVIYKLYFTNKPNQNQVIAEIESKFGIQPEVITSRIEYAGKINALLDIKNTRDFFFRF